MTHSISRTFVFTGRTSKASLAMFHRLDNPFNKPLTNANNHCSEAVHQLLDTLGDKDEQVKVSAEGSLIKIADKKPDEVILFVCDYKKKNPKLADSTIAVILR